MSRQLTRFDAGSNTITEANELANCGLERRSSGRVNERQHVAIFNRRIRLVCDLVDVSQTGAKLRIVEGAVPLTGEPLALTLLDGTAIAALVSWADETFIGLEFLEPLESLDQHLALEGLGRNYFGRAVALQKQLSRG